MKKGVIMFDVATNVAVDISEKALESSTPEERKSFIVEFEKASNYYQGKVLHKMRKSEDYTHFGYSYWEEYVSKDLPFSKSTANRRIKAYLSSISDSRVKVTHETETNLKEDYIDVEVIKNKCVPKSHHSKIEDATNAQLITIEKRFDEVGSKWVWETFEMPDETFKMFTDKVVSKSELLSAIEFEKKREEFTFEEWTVKTLEIKKSLKREREANDNIRAVLAKQEEQRKKRLPRIVIQYESIADIARELIDYLTDNNINIGSFRTQISKELKIRKEAAK